MKMAPSVAACFAALAASQAAAATLTQFKFEVRGGDWYVDGGAPFGAQPGTYRGSGLIFEDEDRMIGGGRVLSLDLITGTRNWTIGAGTVGTATQRADGEKFVSITDYRIDAVDELNVGIGDSGSGFSLSRTTQTPFTYRVQSIGCQDCATVTLEALSFDDVLRDAVSVSIPTNGTRRGLQADFRPKFGLSLVEAASLAGFDHFNWVNIVTEDPLASKDPGALDQHGRPPEVPFFDPVPGGYRYQSEYYGRPLPLRDDLPWYLDELYSFEGVRVQPGSGAITVLDLRSIDENSDRIDDLLRFIDTPCSPSGLEFTTALAGVRADGTGTVFRSTIFHWGTLPAKDSICEVFMREPVADEGTESLVEFRGFIGAADLSPAVMSLLAANGIDLDVPNAPVGVSEPSPQALLVLGLAALTLRRRPGQS